MSLFGQRCGLHGRSDRPGPGAGGGSGRTMGADRLRAEIGGTGGDRPAKIAMTGVANVGGQMGGRV